MRVKVCISGRGYFVYIVGRSALCSDSIFLTQWSEVPDSTLLYSDYLPELSRHLTTPLEEESTWAQTSWAELQRMDLPSFRPAFLVLCRVLLNVIHECLKLRLEQRPAGKPSLLSIKQVCYKGVEPHNVFLSLTALLPLYPSCNRSRHCVTTLSGYSFVCPDTSLSVLLPLYLSSVTSLSVLGYPSICPVTALSHVTALTVLLPLYLSCHSSSCIVTIYLFFITTLSVLCNCSIFLVSTALSVLCY